MINPLPQAQSHKHAFTAKLAIGTAAALLSLAAVFGIGANLPNEQTSGNLPEYVSPDYTVEHVSDRISAKLAGKISAPASDIPGDSSSSTASAAAAAAAATPAPAQVSETGSESESTPAQSDASEPASQQSTAKSDDDAAAPAEPVLSDTGYRIRTRSLVVDASRVSPEETIEDIYAGTDDEKVAKILYQSESVSSIYDFGDPTEYVAYLDIAGDNGKTEHPQDAVFTYDTTAGEAIDNVRYDKDTGLAYIPREFFESERIDGLPDGQCALLAQTLSRYDTSRLTESYEQDKSADVIGDEPSVGDISRENTVPVEISTNAGSVSKMSQVPLIGNQFAIALVEPENAGDVSLDEIEVGINDGATVLNGIDDVYIDGANEPSMSYDTETGALNIYNISPASLMNVTATVQATAVPARASSISLATAGAIEDANNTTYTIGHYGVANCSGAVDSNGAATKTISRFASGGALHKFTTLTKSSISTTSCAYVIKIGKCPSAIGSKWTADGSKKWRANCVHATYPTGDNPPSGGYYKILDTDWNNQTVTIAFFITCEWESQQEGGMVLCFEAPRTGEYTVTKKANKNTALGTAWKSSVAGAVYGIYDTKAHAQSGKSTGLVKKITTDSKGKATAELDEGKYYVRELSVPWPYLVSDKVTSVSIKPKSKEKATLYDDTVPPIQIQKRIVPSAGMSTESDLMSGSTVLGHIRTVVSSDGKSISTTVQARTALSNIAIGNSSTSVLDAPTSSSSKFSASTGRISSMSNGESITVTQKIKPGTGWANTSKTATICSVSASGARTDMSLPLPGRSLAGTKYGIYRNSACTSKVGECTLDANGIGYYGKKDGEILESNTTYYVREVAGANGYTVSADVYPVTTARNSQVSVSVADSFATLGLTKASGTGKSLTDKLPQFTLVGARYGVYTNRSDAATHNESKVCRTLDGRAAVITTGKFGQATEVSLGAGTYYIAELPSSITRAYPRQQVLSSPANIDAEILSHDYSAKSNGKWMVDEDVKEVTLRAGTATFVSSAENIPVRIQLRKQSLNSELASTVQYSLNGAVFGVYTTEAAAKAAPTGHYGDSSFSVSTAGAVAVLYGNKDGLTTVSGDLPLADYYIKELRTPANYKLQGKSHWMVGSKKINGEILHLMINDFLGSGKYIDGILSNPVVVRVNEPEDVTVQVHKDAEEVPDSMKVPGDAMSLAGARFAIYKTYNDARDDKNRVSFRTSNQSYSDTSLKTLLTSGDDGLTDIAVNLPANLYWIREIEPPHVISDDPEKNAKNAEESLYLLDTEPFRASFGSNPASVAMTAYENDRVKPVSITIGKYAMSLDPEGRNLHVGEKDADGNPYNDAYTDSAFEGAIFGLFDTREKAEKAPVTDDVNDVSVEQKAYEVGAVAVMTSDENGVCGSVDNLKWKSDGYYVRELKAPTSGCYQRNPSVLQVGVDKNTENSEHIWMKVDQKRISKHFEVDEMPDYYYVKIEKVSSDPSVLSDTDKYDLEGIHFGIYKTREEAAAATGDKPGKPLYNLYTKKVEHDDGTIHYEATSGLTGPGTFWAKELVKSGDKSNGFQVLSSPIQVEAKKGSIPRYDTTPIVPEYDEPKVDPITGQMQYKTAKDIDMENNVANAVVSEVTLERMAASREAERMASLLSESKVELLRDNEDTHDNVISVSNDMVLESGSNLVNNNNMRLIPTNSIGTLSSVSTFAAALPAAWPMGLAPSYFTDNDYNDPIGVAHFDVSRRSVPHISYILRHDFRRRYMNNGRTVLRQDVSLATDVKYSDTNFIETTGSKTGGVSFSFASDGTGKVLICRSMFDQRNTVGSDAYSDVFRQYTVYPDSGYKIVKWVMRFDLSSRIRAMSSSQHFTYITDGIETTTGGTLAVYDRNSHFQIWAETAPCTYTVSFNANGGSGASSAKTATYDAAMPAVSKPTRTGYIFQGYYDATSGGTQYYKADGTSARTWNKASAATLYAQWKPITYYVKYSATDPDASLKPGVAGSSLTTTETYDKASNAKSAIFYKFGYKCTGWRYTDDSNTARTISVGASIKNLTATNGKTVTMTPVWSLNEYQVKFNDGLSTQWGPAPVVESGTNPDTGLPWSLGYQQKLYYDDYATDGISSDTLTPIRYSHPNFAFKYWKDDAGNKYNDRAAVQNLTTPGNVKVLTGVWTPSFDYGVDCDPNIIVNQPIVPSQGSITIQKTVHVTDGIPNAAADLLPNELNDLSGIIFELFSDQSCTNSVATASTDARGVATFGKLAANTTYYVREKEIPERLAAFMSLSDEVKTVRSDSASSYEYENEYKQISIELSKVPSQEAVETISNAILDDAIPDGAKFAVYASENDAKADENRLQFYDERGHLSTVATVARASDEDGTICARCTISGLPDHDLWLRELTAPDHGYHEYLLSPEPIFVDSRASNLSAAIPVSVPNDMPVNPKIEVAKTISSDDLAKIPAALHSEAQALCDGIEYALYLDREDAALRNDSYVDIFSIEDGKGQLSDLPYGTYYIIEWSVPEKAMACGVGISNQIAEIEVLSTEPIENAASTEDTLITQRMYLRKVDVETHDPISGVIFDIYADDKMEELLCSTSACDAGGIAVSDSNLLVGRSYFVVERYDSLPDAYSGQGLGSDNTWSGWVELELGDTIDDATVVENTKNDEKGSIEVHKASNTNASPAGAVFGVYDATGALYAEMTTDENGTAAIEDISVGKYTVRETVALSLHSMTENGNDEIPVFEGEVLPDQKWIVNDGEPVINYQGYIRIHKESANKSVTDALPDAYSLAGAVYSIYPVENGLESATPLSVSLITDESGNTDTATVPLGSYKVVETTEPANFSTPEEKREFYVDVTSENATADSALIVESYDEPISSPLAHLTVEKRSAETFLSDDGAPQGTTSMQGTKFAIEYTSEIADDYATAISSEKEKTWVIATDEDGRATFDEESIIADESDELYRDSDGNAALPVGTIVVRETVPPVGYTLGVAPTTAYRFNGSSGKFEELVPDTDEVVVWDGDPVFTAANDIYRADISFRKVDAYNKSKNMSGIPFILTLLDENGESIEQHLIATGENGYFSSAEGSIEEINANDEWMPGDVVSGTVPEDFAPYDSRVWFSGAASEVEPSSSRGALIYGDYELREFYRDDTTHYQSLEPIRFSVCGYDDHSWVEMEDGTILTDGNLTEAIGEIQNHSIHITGTEFTDKITKSHVMTEGNLIAQEVISFADATPGEEYVFEVEAYDADTGEPITKQIKDIDGEIVDIQAGGTAKIPDNLADGTDEESSEDDSNSAADGSGNEKAGGEGTDEPADKKLENTEGTVRVDISLEGYENIEGKKIGLKTRVYHNGYLSDIHNDDLKDDAEAISFAKLETTAIDTETGGHIGFSDGSIDITDTVTYTNLVINQEYEMRGTLMDSTGSDLRDANGNTITATREFKPTERDGQVEMTFTFDMESNTDFTAVAYERLYLNGNLVGEHADPNDKNQTVRYPSMGTTATDALTGLSQGNANEGHGTVEIIDKISYKNLPTDREYVIRGFAYVLGKDDENGKSKKTLIPGSEQTASLVLDEKNTPAEMRFTVPAEYAYGHRILIGEEILLDGEVIAQHDGSEFSEQTVSYPIISTTAVDYDSKAHIGNGEDARKIVDTVHLEGLKPGTEYRIDGTVVALNGNGEPKKTEIVSELTFTAEHDTEDRDLIFELPTDFPGESAVVYEQLSDITGKHVLAVHEDPKDDNQTVQYPKIGTQALHPVGQTQVGSNIDNKIVDTVSYENLHTDYEYELIGMLVDKSTGEFIDNADGTAPVMASVVFSPDNKNGTVDVPFDLTGVDTRGKTIVVYERLSVIGYETVEGNGKDDNSIDGDAESSENGNETDDEIDGNDKEQDNGADKGDAIIVVRKSLVATHCDIDADKQTMFYPALSTTARDKDTGTHIGSSLANGTVIDVVEYRNLIPGYEYEVSGMLMDKATGEPVVKDDEEVISSVKFSPTSANGTVEVEFPTLPPEVIDNRTIVVFEKLLLSGHEIAEHADRDDADQSVSYPAIRTTVRDGETGLHEGSLGIYGTDMNGKTTVIDTVIYSNLVPGREYKVKGALVDKAASGNDDGTIVLVSESEAVFTPQEPDGSTEVVFEISNELLNGKVFVAFEKLYDDDGNEIANHEDLSDDEQTVSYPRIKTMAKDKRTETHAGSTDSVSIIDTVAYEGLIAGHKYVMYGTLMNKDTGGPVLDDNSKPITAETEFTAEENGVGDVEVELSCTDISGEALAGRTFVVFERLEEAARENEENPSSDNNENDMENNGGSNESTDGSDSAVGDNPEENESNNTPAGTGNENGDDMKETEEHKVIASHKDLNDESQSVHYVKITRTLARAGDGEKLLEWSKKALMSDTVLYENAVPGIEYVLDGSMMRKDIGETQTVGGSVVVNQISFIPESANGEAEVIFELDSTTREIAETVVFEKMSVNGTLVGAHTDMNSEDQSMYGVADELVETGNPLDNASNTDGNDGRFISKTGDDILRLVLLAGGIAMMVCGWRILRKER